MRQIIKIPRIVKIENISGHKIQCMFNNGESRLLDFAKIFKQWNITENDTRAVSHEKRDNKVLHFEN